MTAGDSSTVAPSPRTWLRQWREREGVSQDWMGERVGVSRNRWSEIEGGESPAFDAGLEIEKVTGIPPREFFRTDPLGRKHPRRKE